MPKRFVLIDYENVQPKALERLNPKTYAVLVFVGANQARIPTNLFTDMQRFDFRFIQVCGTGRDALDFHIAYYLGRIAASEPDASFYVVSADAGYDPLIQHLAGEKIAVRRVESLDEIFGKVGSSKSPMTKAQMPGDRLAVVIDDLKRRGNSKPRTIKALRATINARFQSGLTDQDLSALIDQLTKQGTLIVKEGEVSYTLPA